MEWQLWRTRIRHETKESNTGNRDPETEHDNFVIVTTVLIRADQWRKCLLKKFAKTSWTERRTEGKGKLCVTRPAITIEPAVIEISWDKYCPSFHFSFVPVPSRTRSRGKLIVIDERVEPTWSRCRCRGTVRWFMNSSRVRGKTVAAGYLSNF